jgi:hypothetical protein
MKLVMAFVTALPLAVALVLMLSGIQLGWWVYLVIVLICPLVGGILYAYYRGAGRKMRKSVER